ncbi:MAG: hypothetical protein ACRBN8_13815 [Nannocystales bacterium]
MRGAENRVELQEGLLDAGHVSTLVIETVRQSAIYLRIVAWVTLASGGFSALAAVGAIAFTDLGRLGFIAILPHFVGAGLGIACGLHLRSAAATARKVGERGLLSDLEGTLGHQLLYWRIVGVSSVVGALLVLLGLTWVLIAVM